MYFIFIFIIIFVLLNWFFLNYVFSKKEKKDKEKTLSMVQQKKVEKKNSKKSVDDLEQTSSLNVF